VAGWRTVYRIIASLPTHSKNLTFPHAIWYIDALVTGRIDDVLPYHLNFLSIMIVLSHHHSDKQLVDQLAVRLATAFGEGTVYYDSWSLQPGNGIGERMPEALAKCTHFFYLVTPNASKGGLLSLEWQNAILRANKQCKIVAIRADAAELPPTMTQSLSSDMHTVGGDAALAQIADVVRGAASLRKANQQFNNLCFSAVGNGNKVVVTIKAQYFLEPVGSFMLMIENASDEFTVTPLDEEHFNATFSEGIELDNGYKTNAILHAVFRGITPAMPVRVMFTPTGDKPIVLGGVLHRKSFERWDGVPLEEEAPSFRPKSAY
jgi:hypothetical protein